MSRFGARSLKTTRCPSQITRAELFGPGSIPIRFRTFTLLLQPPQGHQFDLAMTAGFGPRTTHPTRAEIAHGAAPVTVQKMYKRGCKNLHFSTVWPNGRCFVFNNLRVSALSCLDR